MHHEDTCNLLMMVSSTGRLSGMSNIMTMGREPSSSWRARYTLWIELLLIVTDPFLIGGILGSPASGKMMVVLVLFMMIFRLIFPFPSTVA